MLAPCEGRKIDLFLQSDKNRICDPFPYICAGISRKARSKIPHGRHSGYSDLLVFSPCRSMLFSDVISYYIGGKTLFVLLKKDKFKIPYKFIHGKVGYLFLLTIKTSETNFDIMKFSHVLSLLSSIILIKHTSFYSATVAL